MIDFIKHTGAGFSLAAIADQATNDKMSMVWLALISAGAQVAIRFIDVYKQRNGKYNRRVKAATNKSK
jgi:hypothetical protein